MVIKFSVKIDGEAESFAQEVLIDATAALWLHDPAFVLKQSAMDLVERFFDDKGADKLHKFIADESEIAKLLQEKRESDARLEAAIKARKKKDVR